ncbi:MAG: hypothetical protein HDS21_00805 [Bacteroides sp.]|nr:hypothetical protein [Bacteroides sp.]
MKNKGKVFSFAVALAIAVIGMFLISSCGDYDSTRSTYDKVGRSADHIKSIGDMWN